MVLWGIAQGEAPVYIGIDVYIQVGVLATVSVQVTSSRGSSPCPPSPFRGALCADQQTQHGTGNPRFPG